MDLSEEERLKIVLDAYLKMQPKSRSEIYKEQNDMSSYAPSSKLLFVLLKTMEEQIEKENIAEIKKRVSEFTKQLAEEKLKAEEKRIAKEQRQSEKKRIAEEKRVSEILLPDLEDLDKSSKSKTRSSGGRKKNNKTKKHKK
jgi:hypothetical protein